VNDPMHAIINYLYATAQKNVVPSEVMNDMRTEASNVMEASGGFDNDMKSEVLKGSKKIYNRTLLDGTEINIEITKKESSDQGIDGIIEDINTKKAEFRKRAAENMTVDADKIFKQAYIAAIVDKSLEKDMFELGGVARDKVRVSTVKHAELLERMIRKIAVVNDTDTNNVISQVMADNNTDNKVMVAGELLDSRKFDKYPFNSVSNARKAVGKQVADILTDKLSGNVTEEKLKQVETFGAEDPLGSKLLDKIVMLLKYEE